MKINRILLLILMFLPILGSTNIISNNPVIKTEQTQLDYNPDFVNYLIEAFKSGDFIGGDKFFNKKVKVYSISDSMSFEVTSKQVINALTNIIMPTTMDNYAIYYSKSKNNLKTLYSIDYFYVEMENGKQTIKKATFEFVEYNGWIDTVYAP